MKNRNQTSAFSFSEKRKDASALEQEKPERLFLFPEDKTGTDVPKTRNNGSKKSGTALPLNPFIEPPEEPLEGKRRKPRTSIPTTWPTENDKQIAQRFWIESDRADLLDRLELEAAQCRDYHLQKGTLSG